MEIWAHRGASARQPENTIAAFRAALLAQPYGIEFDVQLSADGAPVVITTPAASSSAVAVESNHNHTEARPTTRRASAEARSFIRSGCLSRRRSG